MPPDILDDSDVLPTGRIYWRAFWKLHPRRDRVLGMSGAISLPLKLSEVESYLERHGLAGSVTELEEGERIVTALDDEWQKWDAARRKAEGKK